MDGPNRVNKLLGQGRLADLVRGARDRASLSEMLEARLPESLRGRLAFGSLDNDVLTLLATSAAWVTRARFLEDELRERFAAVPECASLSQIRIRVTARAADPFSPAPAVPARRVAPVPEQVRELLRQTGSELPPGPIRDALLRLAGADSAASERATQVAGSGEM